MVHIRSYGPYYMEIYNDTDSYQINDETYAEPWKAFRMEKHRLLEISSF